MTKAEMLKGLQSGKRLTQEEWSDKTEIDAVDELIAEGLAKSDGWRYIDCWQCEVRFITAAKP